VNVVTWVHLHSQIIQYNMSKKHIKVTSCNQCLILEIASLDAFDNISSNNIPSKRMSKSIKIRAIVQFTQDYKIKWLIFTSN